MKTLNPPNGPGQEVVLVLENLSIVTTHLLRTSFLSFSNCGIPNSPLTTSFGPPSEYTMSLDNIVDRSGT